jgi:glycosyltransferase involved in cell wall biosynthesis
MTQKTKKILVLSPHPERTAPGQRLKYEQYFDYLQEYGYETTVSPFITEKFQSIIYKKGYIVQKIFWTLIGYLKRIYDLSRIPLYDGVYVFLYVTPFGPPFFESIMRHLAKKYIYDIDDMVFLGQKSNVNPIAYWLKGKKKMGYLMKHAAHVITCTPYLNEYAKKYNKNTTDISSTIKTDIYLPVNNYKNDHTIILGWSGSHSTSQYLYLLEDTLKNLSKKHTFKLLVIGDDQFDIAGVNVESIQWSEKSEVEDLQRIDIGLYPLPDDPWVYGKSSLKALQYMALGIPTIATGIGTTHRVIEDGNSGFLVQNNKEWLEKLELLITDSELRKKIGEKARIRVKKFYSVKVNAPTYLSIFKMVYGNI